MQWNMIAEIEAASHKELCSIKWYSFRLPCIKRTGEIQGRSQRVRDDSGLHSVVWIDEERWEAECTLDVDFDVGEKKKLMCQHF